MEKMEKEAEANSALIEAAPDMLEALETIMDIGDKACRDIARAAIRKARGEA
jgi:antitoxin component HigA of HigAB toxin-antitoxin module